MYTHKNWQKRHLLNQKLTICFRLLGSRTTFDPPIQPNPFSLNFVLPLKGKIKDSSLCWLDPKKWGT